MRQQPGCLPGEDVELTTVSFQLGGQIVQALQNELVVLIAGIRLCPNGGLHHVQAQNRALGSGVVNWLDVEY